jgi:putative ABC transport system ATP-binding protein
MIVLNEITKTYHMGSQTVRALQGINLSITAGEFVAIIGASGEWQKHADEYHRLFRCAR